MYNTFEQYAFIQIPFTEEKKKEMCDCVLSAVNTLKLSEIPS